MTNKFTNRETMKHKRIASVGRYIDEIKKLVENPKEITYLLLQNYYLLKSVQNFNDAYPNATNDQKEKFEAQLAHTLYVNDLDNKTQDTQSPKFKF